MRRSMNFSRCAMPLRQPSVVRSISSWTEASAIRSSWPASSGRRKLSMDHDPRAYLWDAREGADATISFVDGRRWMSTSPIACYARRSSGNSRSSARRCGNCKEKRPNWRANFPSYRRRSRSAIFSFTATSRSTIERCGERSTKACRRCALGWPRCSIGQGTLDANHVSSCEDVPAN